MRLFYCLSAAALLGLTTARAQQTAPRLSTAELEIGGLRCAQAHAHAAARTATTSVRHRQKMDRYDVSYYKLDITLANNSLAVSGSGLIRARNVSGQPLDSLAFELFNRDNANNWGYSIDSVVVNGRRSAGWRRAGSDVTAALPQTVAAGGTFEARIYYRGTAPHGNTAAIGNALATDSDYGVNVTWSLSEPFSAHEWFPVKQVLTDKADSSAVWVTTASTNKVGSNGVLRRVTPLSGNRSRYEWHSSKPIDYYLISVAVGPYLEYVNYANPTGGPRIPIVNYVYNQAALTDFRTEIDRTPGFIENYSNLVGLYPFASEKYGHSMAPIGGGMEHQTMTTQDGFSFTLTAHELFHQWFGDNVTCASWEDIWLNESFASYGEYLSLSQFSGAASARQWLDLTHKQAANTYNPATRDYDNFQPGGSVRVPDTTNVGRIFSSRLSYKKGATVIHMLRYLLRDDTKFFRALRTYQSTYAGHTARTADLQRIFEQEAGTSLQYFFDQWYRGEGYPGFAVRWNQVGSTLYLRITETASMPTVTPFFQTDVDYRIRFSSGQTTTVRLSQTTPTKDFSVSLSPGLTVVGIDGDPDQWILDTGYTFTRDNALSNRAAQAAPRLSVYPNPAHDLLRLPTLPARTATAEVTDVTGRVVLRHPLSATTAELPLHQLAPGIYHLRLQQADGTPTGWARFVKE